MGSDDTVNVGRPERWLSVAAGVGLLLFGLRRRALERAVIELAGAVLAYRGVTGRCPVYHAVGADTSRHDQREMPSLTHERGIKLERSVTIARPAAELYRFWRNFENLPPVIPHLESVTTVDPTRSHWVVRGAGGKTIEWDADVVTDREGELIVWQSVPDADIDHGGSVTFSPTTERGTAVKLVMNYRPPGGKVGVIVGRLLGDSPDVQLREGLRRFKQLMEAGEIATTSGQPVGGRL
jgi:uncharacterized membrane protein